MDVEKQNALVKGDSQRVAAYEGQSSSGVGAAGGPDAKHLRRDVQHYIDLLLREIKEHRVDVGNLIGRLQAANFNISLGKVNSDGMRYNGRIVGNFEDLEALRLRPRKERSHRAAADDDSREQEPQRPAPLRAARGVRRHGGENPLRDGRRDRLRLRESYGCRRTTAFWR